MKSLIAKVAVENTLPAFDSLFAYFVPNEMELSTAPGKRVLVPFGKGNQIRQGIIFFLTDDKDTENTEEILKPISEILDEEPILNKELLKLAQFIKERTFSTYYASAKALLPGGLSYQTKRFYTYPEKKDFSGYHNPTVQAICDYLSKVDKASDEELERLGEPAVVKKYLILLKKDGILTQESVALPKAHDLTVQSISLSSTFDIRDKSKIKTKTQRSVVDFLFEAHTASLKEICYYTGVSPAVVRNLIKTDVCTAREVQVLREPEVNMENRQNGEVKLSEEQDKAYRLLKNAYSEQKANTALLYGVTGSGKTAVYSELIATVLHDGKSAIVLVPEIALTPQTLSRFRSRFGKQVAVLHSGLSVGERYDEYKRIQNGEAQVVIGTRSAVFAPLQNIGVIIMDEEQEHTYKSEQAPRYHAKDVAKFRCAYHNALLVLASATPSLDSFAKAQSGKYLYCKLLNRYGSAILPQVQTVDMTDQTLIEPYCAVSRPLSDAIARVLEKKEQVILLVNRRGYNTFVACGGCKHVITCPSCSISLTYHSANHRLLCHYCGYSEPYREVCPICGESNIRYSGFGTQRIEQELKAKFPSARVLRMDADTTGTKNAHDTAFTAFSKGEYDIMVGTQMVAKGLDFENVTLVGVISADSELYNDNFRSAEKTFDLITQVVGRAGRGKKQGIAMIQTVTPDNIMLTLAAKQDYDSFFNQEINVRKALIYPPFCDICVVMFSGEVQGTVLSCAKQFLNIIKEKNEQSEHIQKLLALGPIEPRVSKINKQYRYKIMIKCKNSIEFRQLTEYCLQDIYQIKEYKAVSVYADINPENTDA